MIILQWLYLLSKVPNFNIEREKLKHTKTKKREVDNSQENYKIVEIRPYLLKAKTLGKALFRTSHARQQKSTI